MVWDFKTLTHPFLVGDSWSWYKEFLSNKASSTQRGYATNFISFLEYHDMNSDELYNQYLEASNDKDDPRRKKVIASKVLQYQRHLIDNLGKSTGTANNVYKSIRAFFTANEIDFKINGNKIKVVSEDIPTIEKDALKNIIDVCGSARLVSLWHLLKDSGMRVSDACEIKLGDIRPVLDDSSLDYYTWEITPVKTPNRRANPCLGVESITWIRKWMDERERLGIKSDWLFCMVENYGTHNRTGDKGSRGNYVQLFRHYRDKSGLKKVSIHSLRKYNKTQLEYGGVPESWINVIQGRRGQGSGQVYSKPNPTMLKEMFLQGYKKLQLESTPVEREEFDEIKQQNEILNKQISEEIQRRLALERIFQEEITRRDEDYRKLQAQMRIQNERIDVQLEGVKAKIAELEKPQTRAIVKA